MADETSGEAKPKVETQSLQLVVKDQHGGEVHFKVKVTTKFEKIMNAYCTKKSLDSKVMRFMYEGERINGEQTPQELEMEDGDQIDANQEQLGGCWR